MFAKTFPENIKISSENTNPIIIHYICFLLDYTRSLWWCIKKYSLRAYFNDRCKLAEVLTENWKFRCSELPIFQPKPVFMCVSTRLCVHVRLLVLEGVYVYYRLRSI